LHNFVPYLLDFFGSSCRSIIYVSQGYEVAGSVFDDCIMKGLSIEQIIFHLNEIQPPVESIKDMIIAGKDDKIESFKYDGYYLDKL
jgi:hypothetical protein